MSKSNKTEQMDAFDRLDKRRQTAVKMQFEGTYTDKQIAKIVRRSRPTVNLWKKEKWFQDAFNAYASKLIKTNYKSQALQTLFELLDAKSEMVRLQAATSILKLAGMFLDNSTPELDRAKTRKATAEAKIAESQAKAIENSENTQHETIIVDNLSEVKTDGNSNGSKKNSQSKKRG